MVKDQEIFDLIERDHQRQLKGMDLICIFYTSDYADDLPS